MTEPTPYLSIAAMLSQIPGPNGRACERIYAEHESHFRRVRGSTHNHQAWPGGYHDHVRETMNIASLLYCSLSAARPLGFPLADAWLVLFLHDIEKPWKYEVDENGQHREIPELRDKQAQHDYRAKRLKQYGIRLSPDQTNAMKYVEGEFRDYSNKCRVSGSLAAFCHLCDMTSARIWHDRPCSADDEWSGASRSSQT